MNGSESYLTSSLTSTSTLMAADTASTTVRSPIRSQTRHWQRSWMALLKILVVVSISWLPLTAAAGSGSKSKSGSGSGASAADPYDCKGNTPFLLQDPRDNTCLGPNGFTVCDERALWVLNRRVDRVDTYSLAAFLPPTSPAAGGHCLERKTSFFGLIGRDRIGLGRCSKRSSKNWKFEFVDSNHVLLSTKGMCLIRGALGFANSVSLKPCPPSLSSPSDIPLSSRASSFEPSFPLQLVYSPTAIHENGFYIKASDGTCFDGASFVSCYGSSGATRLLWGIGMRYVNGEAIRYLFLFHPKERHQCLTNKGNHYYLITDVPACIYLSGVRVNFHC
jgi:hypothetical protein